MSLVNKNSVFLFILSCLLLVFPSVPALALDHPILRQKMMGVYLGEGIEVVKKRITKREVKFTEENRGLFDSIRLSGFWEEAFPIEETELSFYKKRLFKIVVRVKGGTEARYRALDSMLMKKYERSGATLKESHYHVKVNNRPVLVDLFFREDGLHLSYTYQAILTQWKRDKHLEKVGDLDLLGPLL